MRNHRHILVGTDFSARAEMALEAAVEIASGRPEARITLLHVVDTTLSGSPLPYDLSSSERETREQEAVEAALSRLRETTESYPDVAIDVAVRRGHPAKELAQAAASSGADLIVTSTQGYGAIKRAILGSITTSLLGYAGCPVLVVGEDRGTPGRAEQVLAAVDLSPVSSSVLEHAFALAGSGGFVRVVSVFDEPLVIAGDHPFSLQAYALPARVRRLDEQRDAVTRLAAAIAPEGARFEVEVVPGSPAHLEVLEQARRAEPDVIVVGASGHRTWSKALFGTNGARIISGCKVPVLVVPDQGQQPSEQGTKRRRARSPGTQPGEQVVYAVFEPQDVRTALGRLDDATIDPDHISVVMSKDTHLESFKDEDQTDQGFLAGSAVGTAVGGVLGGLASLAVTSGIGLVVMGPAVALGLIGGLIGTLVGYGVPEHDAARLQDSVERGKVLIAVHAKDEAEHNRAKTAFADAGAQPRRLWV